MTILDGREVDLVSAIGNPDAFEATVRSAGARVREHRRFADHHAYRAGDLAGLGAGEPPLPVVTTTKDAVKLGQLLPGALALEIDFEPTTSLPALEALLEAIPAGTRRRERDAMHEGLHG